MSETHVHTAVTAMVAALKSAPAVCDEVSRGRRRVVALDRDLSIVVRPVQSEVTQRDNNGQPMAWNTSVAVECYARSGASVAPDAAVDVMLDAVETRLAQDAALQAAVVAVMPQGIGYDFDSDGQQTTCATYVFHVLQRP